MNLIDSESQIDMIRSARAEKKYRKTQIAISAPAINQTVIWKPATGSSSINEAARKSNNIEIASKIRSRTSDTNTLVNGLW